MSVGIDCNDKYSTVNEIAKLDDITLIDRVINYTKDKQVSFKRSDFNNVSITKEYTKFKCTKIEIKIIQYIIILNENGYTLLRK